MELVKKNIHFNRITKNAKNQITLEEDINLPDTKEDIENILIHKQRILIDEVKINEQKIHIRGRLIYSILYQSEETGRLCSLEGSLPIDEHLYMEGVENSHKVTVKANIDDFSVGIINSRKISIQSIIELWAYVQKIYDEQMTVAVENEECEVFQKECNFTQLAVSNKDVFRFRENISIPNNMPNVENIVWKDLSIQEFECKPMDDSLSIQGKIQAFIIYEGERDSHNQIHQVAMPFTQVLECPGSQMNMIPNINYDIVDCQVHMDTDFDGEARNFSVEMVLELDIKLYVPEKVNVLWDVYGIQKEMTPVTENIDYDVVFMNQSGNIKVSDSTAFTGVEDKTGRILYSEGNAIPEKCEILDNGIMLHGMLQCQMLWEGNEENEYNGNQSMIPFSYLVEYPNGSNFNKENLSCDVKMQCSFVQFQMTQEGNMEVKANVMYHLLVFEKTEGRNVTGIDVKEMDMEKYNHLPSMAIYFAKQGDTLWEMGKKYCVPIKQIKEMNHITTDEMKTGEKVLIVRGAYS